MGGQVVSECSRSATAISGSCCGTGASRSIGRTGESGSAPFVEGADHPVEAAKARN
jgi:hypothetical protein